MCLSMSDLVSAFEVICNHRVDSPPESPAVTTFTLKRHNQTTGRIRAYDMHSLQ